MAEDDAVQQEKSLEQLKESSNQGRDITTSITCNTKTLFVGGLHPRICDLHLQKLFAPYGSINRIHLVTHKPGVVPTSSNPAAKAKAATKHAFGSQQSKGYAFVEYATVESARMAISRIDGRKLLGKNLAVRPAKRQQIEHGASNYDVREVTVEEAKREVQSVQSKIDSLKKALEEKTKRL